MGRPAKSEESAAKARRASAERMFAGGASCNDIAQQLHISNETVRRWKKAWDREKSASTENLTPKPYRTGLRWFRLDFM